MAERALKINPEMVTLAREALGLTQPELAVKLSVSQGWLSRIESGLRGIDKEQLSKIADVLEVQPKFFLQNEKLYGLGFSGLFHRKLQSLDAKNLRRIHAQINLLGIAFRKLLSGVEIGQVNIKPLELEQFQGRPKEAAHFIRAAWKIPNGPIHNVVSVLENAGAIIIPFDFQCPKIDAIAYWRPDIPPMFFVNMEVPTDRLRFTLCHELGHMILHTLPTDMDISEHQANEFASEFLMPEKEIKYQLKDLTLEKLMALKQQWKVSMAALLKKAADSKAITPAKAKSLWILLGKYGYRVREPIELDLLTEAPVLHKEIIDTYLEDMAYSSKELADSVGWSLKRTNAVLIGSDNISLKIEPTIEAIESFLKGENPT